jgi:putative membrane protein
MRIAALIVVLLLAVAFAVQNTAAVNVSLLLWKLQASLAIVMALCLALGFLIGLLAVVPSYLKGRRHARNLERQLATSAVIAPPSADIAPPLNPRTKRAQSDVRSARSEQS